MLLAFAETVHQNRREAHAAGPDVLGTIPETILSIRADIRDVAWPGQDGIQLEVLGRGPKARQIRLAH